MSRRLPAAIAVLGLALAGALSGPAAALAEPAPAGPDAPNVWTEIAHPRPGGADTYFHDIAVPAANDVWTVGYTFDVVGGAFEFRTYGQHCVSGVCTRANLPNREGAPATNFLYGIGAYSPTDMWTVGSSTDPGQPTITLAIRYNGSTWQIVNSPSPAGSYGSYLYSVADLGPSNAIAVGGYNDLASSEERPMAMRWDGVSWNLLTLPAVPGCTSRGTLYDVAAAGTATFMAGTCRDSAGADAGFVLSRANNGAWRVQVRPGDGVLPSPSSLQSISLVPGSGVWAVGTSQNFAAQTASGLSIRFDGRSWTSLTVPQVTPTTQLLAVAGIAGNAAWSVGVKAVSAFAEPLGLYWTGSRYVNVASGDYSKLHGVAYDPAGFWWSVGHDLGVSLLQRIPALT